MNEKPTLNIVLVEPRIPQNTGNVARTCACTACRLHLVGPMGFAIDDKKLKHAGLDYWHYLDITYYDGLEDFFAKNSGPFYYFTTKAPQRYTDVAYTDKVEQLINVYKSKGQTGLFNNALTHLSPPGKIPSQLPRVHITIGRIVAAEIPVVLKIVLIILHKLCKPVKLRFL